MTMTESLGIQPYMYKPESDPDEGETPAEETPTRMYQNVSEWLYIYWLLD